MLIKDHAHLIALLDFQSNCKTIMALGKCAISVSSIDAQLNEDASLKGNKYIFTLLPLTK